MKTSYTTMAVFGALVIVFGLFVALSPVGQDQATFGLTGALNLPSWLTGLILVPFGVFLVIYGLRKRKGS